VGRQLDPERVWTIEDCQHESGRLKGSCAPAFITTSVALSRFTAALDTTAAADAANYIAQA
jgi:hypothetical protein